jgi:CheY-like chemotaxis protein
MTALLTGRRILVVEDEMLVLMNMEMALEDLGCSAISAAATVADALHALSTYQFDAALVDVNLGKEKSYPIADALAQRGIPFAFCTGCGSHSDRHDLDPLPVLRKPYLRAELVAMLQQLMPDERSPAAA